ncbi:hypothetical protein H4582DRAFT_1965260 [Lactarius indigo]|nr:hypothetical protein H4582DRAFT_1965260 [Lactarius indigo]
MLLPRVVCVVFAGFTARVLEGRKNSGVILTTNTRRRVNVRSAPTSGLVLTESRPTLRMSTVVNSPLKSCKESAPCEARL